MKRSEINAIIRDNIRFLRKHKFNLPPFAFWTPEQWRARGPECSEIPACGLGWDITDFGSGDFRNTGLFLFTIRNGSVSNLKHGKGKIYAEKIMICAEGQVTPIHFHYQKTEDIINRGGGELTLRAWNATAGERLGNGKVTLECDGVKKTFKAGEKFVLRPGESVCLPGFVYHTFWGEPGKGKTLVGEVSVVNDDHSDNRFLDPVGRFPEIEEDEPPLYLLCNDYPRYYRHGKK